MPQKKKKRNKIERIETLIEQGHYDQAEALLKDIYHPNTPKILARINALRPPKAVTSARQKNKSKRLLQAFVIGGIVAIISLIFMKMVGIGILISLIVTGFTYIGLRTLDREDDQANRSQFRRAGYSPKSNSHLNRNN